MIGPIRSLGRIQALLLRHFYIYRGSWIRLIELAYWPVMQILLWGLITKFFIQHSDWLLQASGALIAGVLLWDTLFRGQLGVSVSFLEELWSRNLGQLFCSPLRPWELLAGLMTVSLVRTLAGMLPAAGVAILLYHYSVFDLGLALVAFFANLMVFSWAVAVAVCALLLRYGLGAETIAWVSIYAIAPLSAVYYPVSVLPESVQWIAWALPTAYVFEGMRAVMIEGAFRFDLFWSAVALNGVYLAGALALFLYAFRIARHRGLLLQSAD
ncbi:MAG: ABC transporter permease [Alphaproteobacteria bacterium]|nr:ABC transporter permease [Alphaproteobacteria bacterium]MCB9928702.1 ABC transporter permease [Alphaproteobacteria bacterium]